jgi:hypothetical protein
MKMTLRRIGLASLGKMGCLLGMVAAFLPSLLCGLLAAAAAVLLHRWLQSWQTFSFGFELPLVGERSWTVDLVELLRLQGLQSTLETVTAASGLTFLLVVLALAVVSGLFLGAIVTLVGLAYNFVASATGGLVVEMTSVAGPERRLSKEPLGLRDGD